MNGDKAQHALPLTAAISFATQHQCVDIIPGTEQARGLLIDRATIDAIDDKPAAVDRIIGQGDMLQRGL